MTEHFQLNQRITHHSGSVWIVRELHRENEFVVPDDYTIECEVAGRGAREVGMTMEVHADYAHQSFRPTPNIANQNPASGLDGLREPMKALVGMLDDSTIKAANDNDVGAQDKMRALRDQIAAALSDGGMGDE